MRRQVRHRLILAAALLAGIACTGRPAAEETAPLPPVPDAADTPAPRSPGRPSAPAPAPAPVHQPRTAPADAGGAPVLQSVELDLAETYDGQGWLLGTLQVRGPGPVLVGTDQFILHARLMPAPAAQWFRTRVSVSGSAPSPLREELFAEGLLELSFPKGPPGEEIVVRLQGVRTSDHGVAEDVTLRLRRAEEPRAVLEVKSGSDWRELGPWDVLPRSPLHLRLRFTKVIDKALVQAALSWWTDQPGAVMEWVDDATLLWYLPQPPDLLDMDLSGVRDQDGLWLVGSLPMVHIGDPPELESVNLDGGGQTALFDLPPEVFAAELSPAGGQLLVRAYHRRMGDQTTAPASWLVNLQDGRRLPVPITGPTLWLPEGALLHQPWDADSLEVIGPDGTRTPAPGVVPPHAPAISLDGRWAAGVADVDDSTVPPGYFYPQQLVLVELGTGTQTELSPFLSLYLPPREWNTRFNLAWSPDGTRVAGAGDTPEGAELVIANLQIGDVRSQVVPLPELAHGSTVATYWSPDGKQLLVGPLVVDAVSGEVLRRLPAANNGETLRHVYWSPDGEWIMYTDQWDEWGPVFAYHLPTGKMRPLGEGLPAGWDDQSHALIVRWSGAADRYIPVNP